MKYPGQNMKKQRWLMQQFKITPACEPHAFRKALVSGCCLLSMASLPIAAEALKPNNTPLQERLQISPSVDDIARQINQQPKWRVLEAAPTIENEKTLYRFKLLNKELGRVKVFIIDPDDPLFKNLHVDKP